MRLPSLLFAAAAGAQVASADFLVITEAIIPTTLIPQFSNIAQATQWTTSVFVAWNFGWRNVQSSLGSAYASNSSSAASEISAFFASNNNYTSVPPDVTNSARTATITTSPDWYSALPTRLRQFKEQERGIQQSVLASVIGASPAGSGGAPGASQTSSKGAAPTGVGAGRGIEWAVAAGALAVFM
ncbi:hypothetical protein B0J11DRAFT_524625 [Dendryphion nanum]|uniref:Uncharacterized protein n=1 Tax=Dendryphion nanum TaxID=256645 RepID=A0A9P9DXQ4_9PLEO|nr:hypothetical protein B0J11DRAFT_524625 [Dendryphion nanum]